MGRVLAVLLLLLAGGCTAGDVDREDDDLPRREPVWSVSVPTAWGLVSAAAVHGDVVVARTREGVGALRRDNGAVVWFQRGFSGLSDRVYVIGDAVVVIGGSVTIDGLRIHDLTTGTVRFTRQRSLRSAVVTKAGLVVAGCASGQGPCTVSRLDLASGQPSWERVVPALVDLLPAGAGTTRAFTADSLIPDRSGPFDPPPVSVVLVDQRSDAQWTLASFDATTGRTLAETPRTARLTQLPVTDQRYLSWDSTADGCPLPVNGHDPASGTQRWTVVVGQWSLVTVVTDREACDSKWRPAVAGSRLLAMTPQEQPLVVDLADGRPLWTGPAGSHLLGLAGDVAVTQADHRRGDLAGTRLDGSQLWKRPMKRGVDRFAVVGSRFAYAAVEIGDGDAAMGLYVLETATGAGWKAAGSHQLLGMGAGWVLGGTGSIWPSEGPTGVALFTV